MTIAEKHIRHYNLLNGNEIRKEALAQFHACLKKDIDSKRIDAHMPFGVECLDIERRISTALKKMNGHKVILHVAVIDVKKILATQQIIPKKKVLPVVKKIAPTKVVSKAIKKPAVQAKTFPASRDFSPGVKPKSRGVLPAPAATSQKSTERSTMKGLAGLGFVTADKSLQKTGGTFRLSGPIGEILGDLQRYKLEIIVAGETHSGKSELGKQIADAFISAGDEVAYLDWEQGGMASNNTKKSIDRNVKAENKKKLHVIGDYPRTLEAVKALTRHAKVIVLDSGTKLNQVTNEWIDQLREKHPDTVWIILMQQNAKGGTRGGPAAEFDAPVVLKTYRPDESNPRKNYAYVYKNRDNKTGLYYLIADKRIIDKEPVKDASQESEYSNVKISI